MKITNTMLMVCCSVVLLMAGNRKAHSGGLDSEYSTILHHVRVNGESGRMFKVRDERTTIECDYQIWGADTAILFAVLAYVGPDGDIHVVKVMPHGTGNHYPGPRSRVSVSIEMPRGVSAFYVYAAPNYTAEEAASEVGKRFDFRVKHYGCAFIVERP